MTKKSKIFVLDTNVILHDSSCYNQFDENQIDHPYLDSHSNGLSYLIDKMQGQNIYSHINLEKGERSELADLASSLL